MYTEPAIVLCSMLHRANHKAPCSDLLCSSKSYSCCVSCELLGYRTPSPTHHWQEAREYH